MKVLASYNIKGGVGKTASCVNLAWLCAQQGWQTLIWDLDPQGASSYYFRIKPKVKGGSEKLIEKKKITNKIKATDFENLDLLPSDFSYRNMDIVLNQQEDRNQQFSALFTALRQDYDYLFIDCPPGISLVSENVLQFADFLLLPTIPTTLSLRTHEQLMDFIQKQGMRHLRLLPFFSMVDGRKKLHRDIIEECQPALQALKTSIPYAADVEKMGMQRLPVPVFSPHSAVTKAYQHLWNEIIERM